MANFGNMLTPAARHPHICEWCYGPIPKGERHKQFKGMWDGEWQNWRMHDECYSIYVGYHPEDGFTPGEGEMPERIKLLMVAA